MKKTLSLKKQSFIFFSFLVYFLPRCFGPSVETMNEESQEAVAQKITEDLQYNNQPILNECMRQIVPILCGNIPEYEDVNLATFVPPEKNPEEEEVFGSDEYEWEYIGTLPNGDHIVYAYWWPAGASGKFTQLAIVRRVGDVLRAHSWLVGGCNHATMLRPGSCKLHGNTLTYHQAVTDGSLYQELVKLFPDVAVLAGHKNIDDLGWSEASVFGGVNYKVAISPEGKFGEPTVVSFGTAEGFSMDDDTEESLKEKLSMGSALYYAFRLNEQKKKSDTFELKEIKDIFVQALECAYDEEDEVIT